MFSLLFLTLSLCQRQAIPFIIIRHIVWSVAAAQMDIFLRLPDAIDRAVCCVPLFYI